MGNKVLYKGERLTLREIAEREELETYYRELDLANFLSGEEERKLSDLQAARTIVEGFFNGQEICGLGIKVGMQEKKNALACLLKHRFLKKDIPVTASLQYVLNKLNQDNIPKELSEKIYKAIIYLSTKSYSSKDGQRIRYLELLTPRASARTYNMIKEYVASNDNISPFETLGNIGDNGNSPFGELISYYESLDLSDFINVDGKLVYSYDNLEQARQIVKEYFSDDFPDELKRAVLMCILENPLLRTNNIRVPCNLKDIVDKLRNMGLEDRKVFAIIINLAIDGQVLDCTYGEVLFATTNFIEKFKKCPDTKKPTEVTLKTIRTAESKMEEKEDEIDVCEYYENLGVDDICSEDGKLCYSESDLSMARQITEGYFDGQEITNEVKIAVLKSLLSQKPLKLNEEVTFDKLAILINKMREKGVVDKDIYGFLINLSLSRVTANVSWSYNRILKELKKIDDILLRGQYNTRVTQGTLQEIMQKRQRKICGKDFAEAGLQVGINVCCATDEEAKALLAERRVGDGCQIC